MESKNEQTEIKTSLPYCLYGIDDRFFELKDNFNTKIKFIKTETKPNRRTSASFNIESIRDRWGVDAHSEVYIYTDKDFDSSDKAEIFTLEIINSFIKRYRYFDSEAVHLITLINEDLFGFSLINKDKKGSISIALGGGIKTSNPLINYQISNAVENSIAGKEEIPLWDDLLLNAEQYLYQAEYRHSVLESVIALELVVSKVIYKFCNKKGIGESEANEYIKNIGLTGTIKITLKLLINEELPEEKVFEKCKGGITTRNNIVHKGYNNINKEQAEETIKYNKILISFLVELLK